MKGPWHVRKAGTPGSRPFPGSPCSALGFISGHPDPLPSCPCDTILHPFRTRGSFFKPPSSLPAASVVLLFCFAGSCPLPGSFYPSGLGVAVTFSRKPSLVPVLPDGSICALSRLCAGCSPPAQPSMRTGTPHGPHGPPAQPSA